MRPVAIALSVGMFLVLAFLFVIGGGLDKFSAPVEIRLPAGFKGPVCARIETGNTGMEQSRLVYEVDAMGFTSMDDEVVRGHRVRKVFRYSARHDGELVPLAENKGSGVLTENTQPGDPWYMVYWVGTHEEWETFLSSHGSKPICSSDKGP
jgi:hypothetical protein